MRSLDLSTVRWRKSSRSGGQGGNCVEVADITPALTEQWRKSSRSGGQGGACVEVADITPALVEQWRKSSHSGGQGGDCVEVADLSPVIAVRDSKNPDGPMLTLDHTTFAALLRTLRTGTHDR